MGIRILGSLKGVALQSKEQDQRVIHTVTLKIELLEGIEHAQDIVENVRQIVELDMTPRQPRLDAVMNVPAIARSDQ